jgi:SAM-dependent methyltransferase
MTLSPLDWHSRFQQQAGWTSSLRQYLVSRLNLGPSSRILEVGCGTGVITASLGQITPAKIFGLDLNLSFLRMAHQNASATRFTTGDALRLPFPDECFDAVVCHFFLLWVPQPDKVLSEMQRVTRTEGAVVAFAEPDYGGRIDYPDDLVEIGRLQADALQRQGADPKLGRKLSALFHLTGLRNIETGLLGGQWHGQPSPAELDSEWITLEADLAPTLPASRLREIKRHNQAAWQSGERTLFVPTFYAVGQKSVG